MKRSLILMLSTAIIVSQFTPLLQVKASDNTRVAAASAEVQNNYVTRDPVYSLNDTSVNRAESEHFQIIWGNNDKTGTVNRSLVEGNLENLENIREFYVNVLGMNDPSTSMTGRISGNYKTNLYIANTGLSKIQDDWAYMSVDGDGFGYMVLDPGALRVDPPSWVVPHEFAHVVTYHMGGGTANGWYEAMANWFRDQYLGSSYYKYGNTTYGPDADFFGPLVFNSDWYFPHTKNWYDAWPILLYITENPDNMPGLGLDLMRKILKDSSTGTMFDKIERLSGTPLKEILGGYSKRMVTYDFQRQDRYKVRLNELLQDGSHNMNEIYTTLERQSDGSLKVPANRAPKQGGYNIDPLDVDLNAKKVTVDFNGDKSIAGADYRVTIVAETYSGDTRYSTTWSDGVNSLNLTGDEKKVYLVVCAAPDTMKDLDIFDSSNSAAKYFYSIKVSTSNEEDKPIEEKPDTPSEEVKGNFEVSTNGSAASGNTLNTALTIKALGNKIYDLSKLKVRYYFTSEGDMGENVWIDSASVSYSRAPWYVSVNSEINGQIYKMPSAKSKADHYVEFTFDSKEILDSSASLYIGARIAKEDWSSFDFTNDYSYKNAGGIVIYYDGEIVNGVEP